MSSRLSEANLRALDDELRADQLIMYEGSLAVNARYYCGFCTSKSGAPTYRTALNTFVNHILEEHCDEQERIMIGRVVLGMYPPYVPLASRSGSRASSRTGSRAGSRAGSVAGATRRTRHVFPPVREDPREEHDVDETEEEMVQDDLPQELGALAVDSARGAKGGNKGATTRTRATKA
jgi:hypothetical protein